MFLKKRLELVVLHLKCYCQKHNVDISKRNSLEKKIPKKKIFYKQSLIENKANFKV